jgi:hypothetical protein
MSPLCVYCGVPLVVGEPFCPDCGRVQPPPAPGQAMALAPNWAPIPSYGSGAPGYSDSATMVVVVLVIVVAVVVGGVMFVSSVDLFAPSIGPTAGSTPIGAVFATGNPMLQLCPSNSSFAAEGCAPTHYEYTLSIVEADDVPLTWVQFEVLTDSGNVVNGTGGLGFTVVDGSGGVVAQCDVQNGVMTMSSGTWNYSPGINSNTLLTTTDLIVIDIGPADPAAQNLAFVAVGTDGASGNTAPMTLP